MSQNLMPLIFSFDSVTAHRPAGGPALSEFSWQVREGEFWAVVGPTASGKTTLGQLLAGRLLIRSGGVAWPLLDRLGAAGSPKRYASDLVYRVTFREQSKRFSTAKHYYQQRYNFIEKDDDLTLSEFLAEPGVSDDTIRQAAERTGVADYLQLSFLKLSNGQTRRARLAKALATRPELLVLDDPFMGVDAAGREDLSQLLARLVSDGQRMILLSRPEQIPDSATHVLELDQSTASWSGPRSLYVPPSPKPIELPEQTLSRAKVPLPASGEPIIQLENVTVQYDGKPILRDLSWTVRAGERWALLGPNGSGKTTLLSLLCGDHPQAYSNRVRLFGRQRGQGESIWDVKKQVGLISPELHLFFHEPLTVEETISTGFIDTMARQPTNDNQKSRVAELLQQFDILPLVRRRFSTLSTGEQRLVLILRALVKRPKLLIMDEPFQGLDATAIRHCRHWLDQHLTAGQTLLFVTHWPDEIPDSVTHRLQLDQGRVVENGVIK